MKNPAVKVLAALLIFIFAVIIIEFKVIRKPTDVAVVGTIANIEKQKYSFGNSRMYVTTEFTTLENEIFTFTDFEVRKFNSPQIGQPVMVIYNKNNPQDARIELTYLGLTDFQLIILLSLVIFLIGIIWSPRLRLKPKN